MRQAKDKSFGKFIEDARFTLLKVSWDSKSTEEILKRESYWKSALGSRAHGLNAN